MTLTREVKQTLKRIAIKWCEDNGIYTEPLPGSNMSPVDVLVNAQAQALLRIEFFAKATASERYGHKIGKTAIEAAKSRQLLAERIQAQIQITPDHDNKMWTRVLNWIVSEEEKGKSFDKYSAWLKAGTQYNRPKTFQLAKNPALIKGNWAEAQAFEAKETEQPKML